MWILKMDPSTSVRGLTAVFLASLSVLIFSAESLVLGSVVVSEDFNSYANNAAVNGLNGGSGWSAPWNSNSGIIANPSGNGSLVRGSFHSSNRSFTRHGYVRCSHIHLDRNNRGATEFRTASIFQGLSKRICCPDRGFNLYKQRWDNGIVNRNSGDC